MKVTGNNVILFERVIINATKSLAINGSNYDITFTWSNTPPGATGVTIGYNDGSWHDVGGSTSSPRVLTIPIGIYTGYRLTFEGAGLTFTSFPVTYTALVPYACAKNCTITFNTETIETSVSGSGSWATFLPTKNSFNISMDGVVSLNEPSMLTIADLHTKQFAHTILVLRYQRTDEAGNVYANECNGYITSSSDTGNFDDMDTFSIDIQGTGAPNNLITQATGSDRVLTETGDYILAETGDFILTE